MKSAEAVDTGYPATELVRFCLLCGGGEAQLILETCDRLHRLPGRFALVRCLDCHFVRLSPRPVLKQLSYYYPPEEYYSYQSPADVISLAASDGINSQLRNGIRDSLLASMGYAVPDLGLWQRALQPLFKRLFKHRIPYGYGDRFPRYRPGGRALEVGCGSGSFLNVLKHHGWLVSGVELSPGAAEEAKETFGIDVFTGGLKEAPFRPGSFDYIHMSHVIEHVANPLELLQSVRDLLKPDGVAYIETPNTDSFSCKRSGPYWLHWDSPRHLCMFAPLTLKRAVSVSGLRVTRMKTLVSNFYGWADVYRREEQQRRRLPNRPRFPDRPRLSPGARLRTELLSAAGRLGHVFTPMSGDVLCCWVTK
jgi:SAM-dependent methyltransferase